MALSADGSYPTTITFDDFYHAHFRGVTAQLCAYTGDLGRRRT
jgi:RNA polymerase sigma-70 factor (ECF subfamily)